MRSPDFSQKPTFHVATEYSKTYGPVAGAIAAAVGLTLDECQQATMDDWLAIDYRGKWVHRRNGEMKPRQNGKTVLLETRIEFGILGIPAILKAKGKKPRGERILYSAHDYSTVTQLFDRLRELFGNCKNDPDANYPELNAKVQMVRKATGKEAIFFTNGGAIYLTTRTKNAKRGFTVDTIICDEAQELTDVHLKAILSTASSAPLKNPQYIFVGTPPGPESGGTMFATMHYALKEHPEDETSISWSEWSVCDLVESGYGDPADRDVWYRTNPALGVRIDEETVESELGTYSTELAFAQERLGYWLPKVAATKAAIGAKEWQGCEVLPSQAPKDGRLAFGVKFTLDGQTAALSAAIVTDEGPDYVELIDVMDMSHGTSKLAEWLYQRLGTACAVLIDGRSGARPLERNLAKLGARRGVVMLATANQAMDSASLMVESVQAGSVTHIRSEALDASATKSIKRQIGTAGGFGFGDGPNSISAPVESAALALLAARTSRRNPKRRSTIRC